MALQRCPDCKQRIRVRNFKLHEKECPVIKQQKKREFNKRVTQSIECRLNLLKQFPNEPIPGNLESIPDNVFNELIYRLEVEKKQAEDSLQAKKEKLEDKLAEIKKQEEEQAAAELKEKQRKEQEEAARLEQKQKEDAGNNVYHEQRANNIKEVEQKLAVPEKPKEPTVDELIRDIEETQSLLSAEKKEPTVNELRELAKAKGLRGYHNMKLERLKEKLGIK
jgi:hypothetical protein